MTCFWYCCIEYILDTKRIVGPAIRLIFVHSRSTGKSINETSRRVGVSSALGYNWQDAWNEHGYAGLQRNFSGGRSPKLSDEQMKTLYGLLVEGDNWTTKEVGELILQKFSIEYSTSQVTRILRDKLKIHYVKPHSRDYRRPENAEQILKKISHE